MVYGEFEQNTPSCDELPRVDVTLEELQERFEQWVGLAK